MNTEKLPEWIIGLHEQFDTLIKNEQLQELSPVAIAV
jgi:hypothetical protein